MLISILIFLLAGLVLIKSSAILVKTLVNIARFLKLSEFVVSFVIMAIATSLPELFIGISSALQDIPSLSLGNVIGANILNLTLVAGLIVIFSRGTEVKSKIIKYDSWFIFLLAVLPILLLLNKTLSRLDGLVLIGLFAAYLIYLFKQKQTNAKSLNHFAKIKSFLKSFLFFAIALVLLLLSAWLIVYAVNNIVAELDISLIVTGIFLISISTVLPEFVFGLRSVIMKHEEMHVGNLLGSVVANSALILGVVSLINPIVLPDFNSFLIPGVFMMLVLLIFNFFVKTKQRLAWWEGALLILLYVIFLIIQVL